MSESQSHPPLRARDSDREAVVEALTGAFVEGQLDPAEHQRRVDVALAAPTVGSLSMLTADLQLSQQALYDLAARGIVALVPVPTPEPKTKLVWAKGRLAALAVVVLLMVGGCLGLTITNNQTTESDFGRPVLVGVGPSSLVLDKPYLDDFVQAYEARFHTTRVVSVRTDDQGLRVVVPSLGSAARSSIYRFDGVRFTRLPGTAPAGTATVDLGELNTSRVAALPDRAAKDLKVANPAGVDLLIGQTDHGPGVRVDVRDADGGSQTMTTDLRGRVTSTSP